MSATPATRDVPAPPRLLVVLLAVATLWHVASFAWIVPNNDFIRDVLFALPEDIVAVRRLGAKAM